MRLTKEIKKELIEAINKNPSTFAINKIVFKHGGATKDDLLKANNFIMPSILDKASEKADKLQELLTMEDQSKSIIEIKKFFNEFGIGEKTVAHINIFWNKKEKNELRAILLENTQRGEIVPSSPNMWY